MKAISRLLAASALASFAGFAHAAEAPKVLASFKPIHSLVAGVMQGVGEPGLVIDTNASPHSYTMKPSDAAKLDKANVVFWIGPGFEAFPLPDKGSGLVIDQQHRCLRQGQGRSRRPGGNGGRGEHLGLQPPVWIGDLNPRRDRPGFPINRAADVGEPSLEGFIRIGTHRDRRPGARTHPIQILFE